MKIKYNQALKYFFTLIMPLALSITMGCTSSPSKEDKEIQKENTVAESTTPDSVAAVRIVEDFFKAFDEKDTSRIHALLLPETKIIHHNGAVTNTAEMVRVINETKNWWPRVRKLSSYEYFAGSNLVTLGLLNEVTFTLPDNKTVDEPYRETWIFQHDRDKWHPIRIHYSKITVDKHSEEVN